MSYIDLGHLPTGTPIVPEQITLRQLYAGLAMQGFTDRIAMQNIGDMQVVAEMAVQLADALIAELEKAHE